jgi:hypothetical protein
MAQAHDVDGGPALPGSPVADSGLLRRIEAIAADVEGTAGPPSAEAWTEALAARLEAGFEERLATEMAALREDLADALEELSAGLQQQLAAIRAAMDDKPAGESG